MIDYIGVFVLAGLLWVIAKIVPKETALAVEKPVVSEQGTPESLFRYDLVFDESFIQRVAWPWS